MALGWFWISAFSLWLGLLTPLGRWEIAEYFGEAVVILGVLAEYVGEFHLFKNKEQEEKRRRVTKRATLVLMFGLAIELTGLVRTTQISEILIADLTKETGDARTSADKAADAAARANSSAEKAEQRALRADEKADRFRLQIAQSKERAAEAEKDAAQARLDLEKFKAPRSLTSEQQERIIARIKPFSGQLFWFSVYQDPESITVLSTLVHILKRAEWVRIDPLGDRLDFGGELGAAGIAYTDSVRVQVAPSDLEETKSALQALVSALHAEGIASIPETNVYLSGQRPKAINIRVGKKP